MLSLGVLVAAFTAFAGWAAFLSVRLYRTCPLGQSRPASMPPPGQADSAPQPEHDEEQEEPETTADTMA